MEKDKRDHNFRFRLTKEEKEELEYLATVRKMSKSKVLSELIKKESERTRINAMMTSDSYHL